MLHLGHTNGFGDASLARWEGMSDLCSLGRHPLFAKALGYINPTHLRCRDEVHWRVEISFAQEPAPGSEVPEDSEEPAGSQTGANAPVDALLGQDDDNGTSLISLRSRSESFSDLGEYAADEYILKAHTAIGLHNGSADQDDKSPRASSCRPMWFTAENNTACALKTPLGAICFACKESSGR